MQSKYNEQGLSREMNSRLVIQHFKEYNYQVLI